MQMGRTLTTAILTVIVGLLVGMGVGGYITYTTTAKYVQSVPGAPIVVGAKYDEAKNAMVLDIFNSGGLPITVTGSGLVFKPKNGNGYAIANIPVNVVIPGGTIARVEIKLKENTEVNIGDILSGTIVYAYPYIPQVYSTTFNLTVGKPYSASPTEVMKKAAQEAEKQKENK
jgi:hypothetical protein